MFRPVQAISKGKANIISLRLYSPCGPWPLFRFLFCTQLVELLGQEDQPVATPLPTQTQNKITQPSMPRVGFEPTTPVLKRAMTIQSLDRAATMIGKASTTKKNTIQVC
jgi:hypothetical protein